jgi:toxin-antitoxin system PIN domain toxin
VILVDANLLVYAHNADADEHERAREWIERQFSGTARVGLPWVALLAFVRLTSNPAIMRKPARPAAAWRYVLEWLERDNVWIPAPGPAHAKILGGLLTDRSMTSRLVPDAHLAALALEHGLTLCTTDGDFSRFAGLKWHNPLAVAPPA